MKVLIVEDELILAMDVRMDLESMGHTVVGIAGSSEAALDIIAEHAPELVLMDIVIQGYMNGIELAKSIAEQYPQCKVLYMTAHSDDDTILHAKQTDHVGILNKPFDPQELKKVLEKTLQ